MFPLRVLLNALEGAEVSVNNTPLLGDTGLHLLIILQLDYMGMMEEMIVTGIQATEATTVDLLDVIGALEEELQGREVGGVVLKAYPTVLYRLPLSSKRWQQNQSNLQPNVGQVHRTETHLDGGRGRGPSQS